MFGVRLLDVDFMRAARPTSFVLPPNLYGTPPVGGLSLLNEIVERLLKHVCKVHSRRPNGPLMRFDDRATDRKSDPHPLQQFCAWQSYIGAKPMIFCSSNWATTRYAPW